MMDTPPSPKLHDRPAVPGSAASRRRRRAVQDQRFTSYLTFGGGATVCLCGFLLLYALVLLVAFPLLQQAAPHEEHLRRGAVLRPVLQRAVERVRHLPHSPGELVAEGVAGTVRKKLQDARQAQHLTDQHLLDAAEEELKKLRAQRQQPAAPQEAEQLPRVVAPAPPGKHGGFMVLGMHRSGTSMLAGLMATGMGYNTGGPLLGGAFDNAKGFFERLDVVYQNDEFMNKQSVWWNLNVINYDTDAALQMKKDGTVDFSNGEKALAFFNDPDSIPWIQKDPRQCITLRTWLPLMNNEPAILFTYRHPLEVANSLKKRESDLDIDRGLRLWILYNKAALVNSKGLCRVYSSNEAVLAKPLQEIQRISDELTEKCGVPSPRRALTQEDVDRFVDPALQHNKVDKYAGRRVLETHDGCDIHDYDSQVQGEDGKLEHELYLKSMRIFCDLKSGKALKDDYEWPEL